MRIVDGSFFLPAQKRDPKAEFAQQHIPGAVFFDIDEIADEKSPLPHMLPPPEKFASRVRKRLPDLPVVDYVSPSVWAWRPWRAKELFKSIGLRKQRASFLI